MNNKTYFYCEYHIKVVSANNSIVLIEQSLFKIVGMFMIVDVWVCLPFIYFSLHIHIIYTLIYNKISSLHPFLKKRYPLHTFALL